MDKENILTKDDVVAFDEAMRIINVSRAALYNAITEGVLHPVESEKIYGMHGRKRYLLKTEVEPLRALNTLQKWKVQDRLRNLDLSIYTQQEMNYGEPIQKYSDIESVLDTIQARNPNAILDYITKKAFKGWEITMKSPGV